MNAGLKAEKLIKQMRAKGSLPAISENVQNISQITGQSDTCSSDIATIIMRDAGLTSNILATANSIYYSPRYPIKTITYAVTFLGFEKVRALALGLSMFKQTMKTAKTQQLAQLYASSYFSGAFAMSLVKRKKYNNPEEIFIAGLLYRLPWLAMANTFPKRFKDMEKLIVEKKFSHNEACRQVFDVKYDEICKSLVNIYNLPDKVAKVLREDIEVNDPVVNLVRESGHLSNMLFGNGLGGEKAMKEIEKRIKKLLKIESFSISDFIKDTCEQDANISIFFHMEKDDVEMMVKALEWGKGNPAQIAAKIPFGDALIEEEEQTDPDVIIGQFLTDLMIARSKKNEINQILMLAQEALYRCIIGTEVFTAFLDRTKTKMIGRFYAGNDSSVKAQDFIIGMNNTSSPIIKSIKNKETSQLGPTNKLLKIPKLQKHFRSKTSIFSPIISRNKVIGLYFLARAADTPFSEKEIAWFEQIVMYVGQVFELSKSGRYN